MNPVKKANSPGFKQKYVMDNLICKEPGCTNKRERTGKWYMSKCWKHRRKPEVFKQGNEQRVAKHKATRLEVLEHYGNKCECCGEQELVFLTIDHIENNGNEHRKSVGKIYFWLKKNNFPDGFRILCFNCNVGRAINGGVCPHQLNKN